MYQNAILCRWTAKAGRLFFKERLSFIMTNEVMEQSRDEVEYGKLYHPQKDVKVIKKDGRRILK